MFEGNCGGMLKETATDMDCKPNYEDMIARESNRRDAISSFLKAFSDFDSENIHVGHDIENEALRLVGKISVLHWQSTNRINELLKQIDKD